MNLFDLPPSRRNTGSIKWDARPEETPENVIPLWVADMDFPAPGAVIAALKERAEHGVFGYTFPDAAVEDAVSSWLRQRFGWTVQGDWLLFFPGVVSSLYMSVSALTEPGENVIIMPPVYYPFREAIEKTNRHVLAIPLLDDNGCYRIDWLSLEAILREKKSRLLIFCSPHNPVGRVWGNEELSRLADLIMRYPDLHVHCDEVHSDLIMPGQVHTPLAKVLDESGRMRLITSRSVSKTFNLAGLKTATLIVENPNLRELLGDQLYITGAGLSNPFGLTAMKAAYRYGHDWLESLIAYIWDNYLLLVAFLRENLPSWRVSPLQGTYLAWIRVDDTLEPVSLLADRLRTVAGVWLEAGTTYGDSGEGYVRVNLGTSRSLLREALERICTYVKA